MLPGLSVFSGGSTTRAFKFVPSSMASHLPWTTLSKSSYMGRFVTRLHRDGASENCWRGQGPFIEFQLTGMGQVATTGIPNIDQFICTQIGHWRELEILRGKLHVARGGSWEVNRDTLTITIKGACLAFTHRKKSFEPSIRTLARPHPWGLRLVVLQEGKITLVP